ncbi:flagellar biosynthesis repressor FlbT [Curvivirga aplysinae]|uniref:flagellar biosynthesis repressor FlbT n=1 Tax=Curvivirga aplysinae TaxID=2529852 RepID=UPI0012BCA76F|nr:flagellar biosynthesis repressor FlbT [Curvivirga aplysinae]MTI10565.1 flagellum biosynthesis protein FlbT [Curvivirga aplysinae]
MPLRIKLPTNEKVIINGAVLENAGDATTMIIHNKVDILRRKEVMNEADAVSPARRVYYALQCAYLFESDRNEYLTLANGLISEYVEAAPSAKEIVDSIEGKLRDEKYYDALKNTLDLIDHETARLVQIGVLEPEAVSE